MNGLPGLNTVGRRANRVLSRFVSKRSRISSLVARYAKARVIEGFRESLQGDVVGRALLAFHVPPLLPPPQFRDRVRFHARGRAQEIVRCLNQLGYVVDIVNFDNASWKPTRDYSVFIGHTGHSFVRLASCLDPDTPKIYLSTGLYWKESNRREARRILQLAERRGHLASPDRPITAGEEQANQIANAILCVGNDNVRKSYSQFEDVFAVESAIFPLAYEPPLTQGPEYDSSRNHFLFFSGDGNIHKGLDLLLEAFAGSDCHLHICQRISPEFSLIYKDELAAPNVHDHGFVEMRSARFLSLVEKCCWTITATCAEGQPGSVLECMAHGLVPILPDEANIDVSGCGLRLSETSVEAITEMRIRASELSFDEYDAHVRATLARIREHYVVERHNRDFMHALKNAGLGRTGGGSRKRKGSDLGQSLNLESDQ